VRNSGGVSAASQANGDPLTTAASLVPGDAVDLGKLGDSTSPVTQLRTSSAKRGELGRHRDDWWPSRHCCARNRHPAVG